MNGKPQRVFMIVPILVVVAVFVSYFYGWEIGARMHPDSTAHDMAELTQLVNEQIDNGRESGTFYIKGISEDEIANINEYICSMNGVVEQFSIVEKSRGGMRVLLKYDISDNYYVYRKYVNGEAIPSDRPAAHKLYEYVVNIIDEIIEPGMSDYEKELAIHDYIVQNCEYGYTDYSKEYAYRAYGVLVQNTAVCNGYAEAMALLLSCVGVENEIMTGVADGELHAWNRVKLDGKWYQVDATWNDPLPDRGSFAGHMYFNVTDDIMDDMHEWDEDLFEACTDMEYNYFEKNNLICDYDSFVNVVNKAASRNITGTIEVVVNDFDEKVYNWEELFRDSPGVLYYSYDYEPYGEYDVITIYLNQGN